MQCSIKAFECRAFPTTAEKSQSQKLTSSHPFLKIRELLAHPESVEKAHQALAESVGKLTLESTTKNGKRTYIAHGKVDSFGEAELAHSGGAGGPDRTTRAYFFSLSLAA